MEQGNDERPLGELSPTEWPEFLHLLAKLVGPDAVRDLYSFVTSPAGLAAMANPATLIHEASQHFGLRMDQHGDPTDDQLRTFVLDGFRMLRSVTAQEIQDPQFLASRVGPDLLAYLERARAGFGVDQVASCFRDTDASTLWSQGTLRGMFSLLRAGLASLDGPFEQRARELARAIGDGTERWYKPLVQVTLRIERLMRGEPGRPIPSTVGQVMGQCRDLWAGGGPVSILDLDLRMIRNADGHREVEIDVAREEVLFVNRPGGDEPPQLLGPWKEGELRAFAEQFLTRCWAMSLACARFIVEETCQALDARDWKLLD